MRESQTINTKAFSTITVMKRLINKSAHTYLKRQLFCTVVCVYEYILFTILSKVLIYHVRKNIIFVIFNFFQELKIQRSIKINPIK